MMFVLFL
jgi:hypothetical protein